MSSDPETPGGGRAAIERWARFEWARRDVGRVASGLAAAGIPVMPLKGVAVLAGYNRDPTQRDLSDADLLVRPRDFAAADATLQGMGWARLTRGHSARMYGDPTAHIAVDLHCRPLPPLMGRMTAARLLARGVDERSWFGAPVVRAAHADLFVHLVCNHLKDGLLANKQDRLVDDLLAVGGTLGAAGPETVAEAATDLGLRAAVWLTLDWVVRRGGAALQVYADTVEPEGRIALARARSTRRALVALAPHHPELSYAVTRAVGDEWSRAVGSAALSLVRAGRDALRADRGHAARTAHDPRA